MAISFRAEHGLTVSVWDGTVSTDEVTRHLETVAVDPAWAASGRFLTDLSGVATESIPDPEQILDAAARFLERLDERVRDAKWAIVASAAFAQARRFGSYLEEDIPRIIVFNELRTACVWLGVNESAVRAIITDLRRTSRPKRADL